MFNQFNILPEYLDDWARGLEWDDWMLLAKEYSHRITQPTLLCTKDYSHDGMTQIMPVILSIFL